MEIINAASRILKEKSVVTIGTFDGVHIGHQKIIEKLVEAAKKEQLASTVLTFFPHPRMVLQKDANIKLINTIEERSMLLERLGLDKLFIKTFDQEFSRLSAEDFVKELLVEQLHAKKVIIGYDHHFGRNRSANIEDLKTFGETYAFDVEEIPAQDIDEVAVSSTKIRKALQKGDMATANAFLGYNFMLSGTVVKGKQLGSTIGFPTANIHIKETYKLVPKQGAYIVQAQIGNSLVYGMMNIGTNPTVDGSTESIEVHFFNFNESLYGKTLQVEILHRLRDEQKFDSVEVLKKQLEIDKNHSQTYLENHAG
ncbi:MAG TPA: bifunctional riboflavin kinase/FAD synthetase [Flavobacteriaceae bacterium]|nr:bifunctional riboflavin kinase/FAD synthetase [Flavobacteriaceae bacterium]